MQHTDVIDGLLKRLCHNGSKTALTLVDGQQRKFSWSWSELQRQRRYCEEVLQAQGLQAGDRLLVMTANNPHFFALLLAALSLHLCLLPVHPDFAGTGLQQLLSRESPELIVVDDLRHLSRLPHPRVLRLHERQQQWLQPVLRLRSVRQRRQSQPVRAEAVLLFHSSGSTGAPKGMCYTRAMLVAFMQHLAVLYQAFPDDAGDKKPSARVNVLPVTHWGGLSFCLQSLLEGRTLHLLRNAQACDHLAVLRRSGCRFMLLVPSLLQELLAAAEANPLPALRHFLAMGEAISSARLQQLSQQLGVRVHNGYGMSECLTGIFNTHDDVAAPSGSCGRLRFGEARLLAADGGEADTGELCVRNPTTTPCYTDAALNQRKYRDRWFHTGDRLHRDTNGYYFFVGRVDAMCVINGRNVYPQEVEQVMLQHPALRACVAVAITVAAGSERLALAVELQDGATADANELLDFYLSRGALFATPVWLAFYGELPLLAGGKPDRQRCGMELQQGYDQAQGLQRARA